MNNIKIRSEQSFGTKHSRDYYKGKSFHFAGKWTSGVHYLNDNYDVDFVVHDQVLLACAKSHLSTNENKPVDFLYNDSGEIVGIASIYWDFVLAGIHGNSPGIRINPSNFHWEICENTNVPISEQIWQDLGVKAKMELSDLSPEDIELLQRPGIEVVTQFVDNAIVQETGQNTDKLMSQKSVTDELNKKASISQLSTAIIATEQWVNNNFVTTTELGTKIQCNTTEYWNNRTNYVPRAGDIIIYSDYAEKIIDGVSIKIPGIKIGSGNAYLSDLAFIGDKEKDALLKHIADTDSHITVEERTFWNNKLAVDDTEEVLGEMLILTRN